MHWKCSLKVVCTCFDVPLLEPIPLNLLLLRPQNAPWCLGQIWAWHFVSIPHGLPKLLMPTAGLQHQYLVFNLGQQSPLWTIFCVIISAGCHLNNAERMKPFIQVAYPPNLTNTELLWWAKNRCNAGKVQWHCLHKAVINKQVDGGEAGEYICDSW